MLWIMCLPTASLFLLLLPCLRGQNGGENEQSTDIISVWEGDSISITCSMKDSEKELGTYLTASIQSLRVLYVSRQNTSNSPPAFAGRIKYSREGRNLRITLHKVQESDSDIYQCSKYIMDRGSHEVLYGKTTIVVVKAKTSKAVEQSPVYVTPLQGESIKITCVLRSSLEDEGIYLLRIHMQHEVVLHVSSQNVPTIHPAFADRLEYSKEENKLVVTLHKLQENDSDIYVCAGVLKSSSFLSVNRSGTMMIIKEVEQTDCSSLSWGIYALAIVVVILLSALVCCFLYHVNMKKYLQKRKANAVYEDMSYSSRRNTLVRTNTYSATS